MPRWLPKSTRSFGRLVVLVVWWLGRPLFEKARPPVRVRASGVGTVTRHTSHTPVTVPSASSATFSAWGSSCARAVCRRGERSACERERGRPLPWRVLFCCVGLCVVLEALLWCIRSRNERCCGQGLRPEGVTRHAHRVVLVRSLHVHASFTPRRHCHSITAPLSSTPLARLARQNSCRVMSAAAAAPPAYRASTGVGRPDKHKGGVSSGDATGLAASSGVLPPGIGLPHAAAPSSLRASGCGPPAAAGLRKQPSLSSIAAAPVPARVMSTSILSSSRLA